MIRSVISLRSNCYLFFNGSNARSIVIIDNASIRHIDEVVQMVSSVGALLWFLPPYSPDLNPIEPVFSQVKSIIIV